MSAGGPAAPGAGSSAAAVPLHLVAAGSPEHAAELLLRWEVLRAPLGMAPGTERSAFEEEALHLVALDGPRAVGCVLGRDQAHEDATGRLFQMAVAPAWRGYGLGRRLVLALEDLLRQRGHRQVVLHARATALGFYERLGYRAEGAPFFEVGLSHRLMRRSLVATAPRR